MSLDKLKREFRCRGSKITDNWIEYLFLINGGNEEKTRGALRRDMEMRTETDILHEKIDEAMSLRRFFTVRQIRKKIEVIVRARNLQLTDLENTDFKSLVFDLHGLTVEGTLNYVRDIEVAMRRNGKSLISSNRTIQLITGKGNHSKDFVPVLKKELIAAYFGRIEEDEKNPGVMNLVVPKQISVWDFIKYKLSLGKLCFCIN